MPDAARTSRSSAAWAERTRSIARRRAIVSSQARALPRAASNRVAVRQASTSTSWATSSAWARSRSTRSTIPKTASA